VPTQRGGGEVSGPLPDPLPPGTKQPVGFVFTLQGVRDTFAVDSAEMRSASGTLIDVYPIEQ